MSTTPPTESTELTKYIFTGAIVPNGIARDEDVGKSGGKDGGKGDGKAEDRLHLSLCLVLNKYNLLADTPPPPPGTPALPDVPAWRASVASYLNHGAADKDGKNGKVPDNMRTQLITQALNGFTCVANGHGQKLNAKVDEATTPTSISARIADLWRRFLNLDDDRKTQAMSAYLDPDPPEVVTPQPLDLLQVKFPRFSHTAGNSDTSPEIILHNMRGNDAKSRLSGLRSLNASERAGITTARGNYVTKIGARLARAGIESLGVRDNPRALVQPGNALRHLETVADKFRYTPQYVREAYNQLISSPGLGRMFGAIIDFSVPLADLPATGKFTIQLDLGNLGAYFDIPPSDMILATPVPGGPVVVLGAPSAASQDPSLSTKYVDSLMVLHDARIFSFDPQAAAKAADEAQQFVAALPDKERIPPHRWSLAADRVERARQPVAREVSTSDVAHDLAVLRRDGKQLALLRGLNNRMANLSTVGHSIYLPGWQAPRQDAFKPPRPTQEPELIRGYAVYVRSIDEGQDPSEWMSLTRVQENLVWAKDTAGSRAGYQQASLLNDEMGIHLGGGVHFQEKGTPEIYRLTDGFLFTWAGIGLSLRSPMLHFESEGVESGEQELANKLAYLRRALEVTTPEQFAMQLNNRKLFGVDWFPFNKSARPPELRAMRTFPPVRGGRNPVQLYFGVELQYLAAMQYHSGYVPMDRLVREMGTADVLRDRASGWAKFLRQEHIRDVMVGLEQDIYSNADRKELRPEHPGESPTDLVVRTGKLLSNEESVRYILPPPVPSFQTYLWYNKEDLRAMGTGRQMDVDQLAHWHRRYACDAQTVEGFTANKRRCHERNDKLPGSGGKVYGCKTHCDHFCGGVQQPAIWHGELRYLPDPVVTGFVAEFFLDKDCVIPAPGFAPVACAYARGRYPQLKPWRLALHRLPAEDDEGSRAERDDGSSTLRVYLEEGAQLFLRVMPACDLDHAHFEDPLVNNPKIPFHVYAGDKAELTCSPLHSNAKVFSLTHAMQQPVFAPLIQQIVLHRYNETEPRPRDSKHPDKNPPEPAGTVRVTVNLHLEHLNLFHGVPIPETTPSGSVELYALWNDYSETQLEPVKSIDAKRNNKLPSGGFVRLDGHVFQYGETTSGPQPVPADRWVTGKARNYWTTMTFRAQSGTFNATHFSQAVFKIRNASKFHRFFHLEALPQTATPGEVEGMSEDHVRWSDEFMLSDQPARVIHADVHEIQSTYLPNNRKPEVPRIRKIVPLIVDERDESGTNRLIRGDRVRIYLEQGGRMHSGQAERVGVVVHEQYGIYPALLAEFKSKAGRDIVTDCTILRSADPALHGDHLTVHEFGLDPAGLEDDYMENFRPEYDRHVWGDAGAIGLVSYVPQFDAQQGLWYFDPEIRIRNKRGQELHNAFVQLGLVGYQPWSANYNTGLDRSPLGYKRDLRISDPVKADFFSVYPSRGIRSPRYVLFQRDDSRRFSLSGSVSSLFFQKRTTGPVLASQFILVVQKKDFGGFWKSIPSQLDSLEFLLDGATLAERGQGEPKGKMSQLHHCLLPWALGTYLHGEDFVQRGFECELTLDFDPGFLESRRSGNCRVVIYEVEWFNYDENRQLSVAVEGLLAKAAPALIPDLRIKETIII